MRRRCTAVFPPHRRARKIFVALEAVVARYGRFPRREEVGLHVSAFCRGDAFMQNGGKRRRFSKINFN